MNKAILVIDMPKNCEDCPLFRTDKDFNATINYCMPYQDKELFMVKEKGISEKCPLKPMPQRKDESRAMYGGKDYIVGTRIDEGAVGWNACIDEILGEE